MEATVTEEVILEHRSLVNFVVNRMSSRLPAHLDLDDLRSSGTMGLLDAATKFDGTRGTSFKTYAEYRIRGAILDDVRRQDWVPRKMRVQEKKLALATRRLEQSLGRKPYAEEVATASGVPEMAIHRTRAAIGRSNIVPLSSLTHVDDAGGQGSFEINLKDENAPNPLMETLSQESLGAVKAAMQSLSTKERQLLSLYYWKDLNMKEIAAAMGLTEGRVSQIRSKALEKLRKRLSIVNCSSSIPK